MGLEGGKKKTIEKVIRTAGLAAMVAGKLMSGDGSDAKGMAGNREALRKLNGPDASYVLNNKEQIEQNPPKKEGIEDYIKEDEDVS
jgi:hypothetical protein